MSRKREPTTDAVEILHRRYFEGKPEMIALLEKERTKAEIARQIYDLRTEARLTQKELAILVGTSRKVIDRSKRLITKETHLQCRAALPPR
jgi:hypothetical protein